MANKKIFKSNVQSRFNADTTNEAGGKAYQMSAMEALAQYAVTGVFGNTYYVNAQSQLDKVLENLKKIDSTDFISKLAVYSRKEGFMKDMPAFLMAYLTCSQKPVRYYDRVFNLVIDNGKMLQNFVQIMRSGTLGRNSLGSKAKRMVKEWLNQDPNWIFKNSIGQNPSLADILKLAHPHPKTRQHEALFAYLIGKDYNKRYLPSLVKEYEAFKKNPSKMEVPSIPFQFLASLEIPDKVWKDIARNGGWQMVRMNLNTFNRHNVFEDPEMVNLVAQKLRDESYIQKSRVFPYQLMVAYKNAQSNVPNKIALALQDAMEIATQNVPTFEGNVFVLPDVSGSMSSPVTGYNGSATSQVRCHDVAALVAASILRKNEAAVILPFEETVRNISLNPRDSVMTNASKLSQIGGGGTNCSAPLQKILRDEQKVDLIIFVSDNQSWLDNGYGFRRGTKSQDVWNQIKRKNPRAKMVCIDITPYDTTQVKNSKDVLNIGGFSDNIFKVIETFVKDHGDGFVQTIEKVKLWK